MQMTYPSICEIHDAVLALLAVCLSRRESVARLETERCALGGLVECGFARQRCVAAALADHDPAALPVSSALLQVLHVSHAAFGGGSRGMTSGSSNTRGNSCVPTASLQRGYRVLKAGILT